MFRNNNSHTKIDVAQNENVTSVQDALEQLVSKESLQGYTCTKSKVEVRYSSISIQVYTNFRVDRSTCFYPSRAMPVPSLKRM